MGKLRLLDLFSGIGGFSLGLERSGGFETVAFCEIEEYPRRVLAKHWPKVPIYGDIRGLTADTLRRDGIGVDAICGGFPCQDISTAGLGAGLAGERSGLWSHYRRLIGELRPKIVIVENVSALLSNGMGTVLGNLAALGYDCWWDSIPACALGAPHERDRVWIVAHPHQDGESPFAFHAKVETSPDHGYTDETRRKNVKGGPGSTRQARRARREVPVANDAGRWASVWQDESPLVRVVHGVSAEVDSVAALGNSVVPQIPEMIGHAIQKVLAGHPNGDG